MPGETADPTEDKRSDVESSACPPCACSVCPDSTATFNISIRIAFFRGSYLGPRELVAVELQRRLVKHFEGASAALS